MKRYLGIGLICAVLFAPGFCFAQEVVYDKARENEAAVLPVEPQEEVIPASPAQEQEAQEATEWVWGDVVSVDAANRGLNVKYLDYETDAEKEIAVCADEKTIFEGVGDFNEIKVQDNVSIDYIVSGDGKNIARLISVEKMPQATEADASE